MRLPGAAQARSRGPGLGLGDSSGNLEHDPRFTCTRAPAGAGEAAAGHSPRGRDDRFLVGVIFNIVAALIGYEVAMTLQPGADAVSASEVMPIQLVR